METLKRPETTGADISNQDKAEALISLLDEYIDHLEYKAGIFAISGVSNSGCPKCGCNKITGDASKAWCLNEKCDFVTTDC